MVDASPPLQQQNFPPPVPDTGDIRRGIELLYFGYGSMIRTADVILAERRLGRAHHRALYFISRRPGLAVSDLLRLLAVSKQSLSRVLGDLLRLQLVEQAVCPDDRRRRLLSLTPAGVSLEAELFAALHHTIASAYAAAGPEAVAGFRHVLHALLPADTRQLLAGLGGAGKLAE